MVETVAAASPPRPASSDAEAIAAGEWKARAIEAERARAAAEAAAEARSAELEAAAAAGAAENAALSARMQTLQAQVHLLSVSTAAGNERKGPEASELRDTVVASARAAHAAVACVQSKFETVRDLNLALEREVLMVRMKTKRGEPLDARRDSVLLYAGGRRESAISPGRQRSPLRQNPRQRAATSLGIANLAGRV